MKPLSYIFLYDTGIPPLVGFLTPTNELQSTVDI